ncbi:MAG: hypothetical protein ACXWEY_00665 [Bacteroidia bacterium]
MSETFWSQLHEIEAELRVLSMSDTKLYDRYHRRAVQHSYYHP